MTGSGERGDASAKPRSVRITNIAIAVAAVAVLAFAAWVRYAALSSQPGGLYPDEGAEALDAYRLLHVAGFHPVFFHDDGGREALYAYVVAAAFRGAGESVTVLRAVSATIGLAAVAALYPALRRFGRGVALAGGAWAAGSLWLICISRDGMRNIMVPLFAALLLWALLHWADRPGRTAAILAGLAAGAGLWTYQPLKLTPLLVVLWLLWLRHADGPRYRDLAKDLGWFAVAYVVVALPMLLTAVLDPVNYFGRAAGVSPFNPANSGISLLSHTLQTLGMFAFTGDPNGRHDVASLPLLGWPLFVLAGLGAWRAWRHRADAGHALLLIGIPVFLLPPLLGVDGWAPHFLRSVGLAPFLAGLVGIGCLATLDLAMAVVRRDWVRPVVVALLALLLGGLGAGSAVAYFSRPVSARYEAYSYDVVAVAAAVSPGDAVIIDDYNRIDIDFLDAGRVPPTFLPGSAIANPSRFSRILALRRKDIDAAIGAGAGARAVALARAPDGRPTVFAELQPLP